MSFVATKNKNDLNHSEYFSSAGMYFLIYFIHNKKYNFLYSI